MFPHYFTIQDLTGSLLSQRLTGTKSRAMMFGVTVVVEGAAHTSLY